MKLAIENVSKEVFQSYGQLIEIKGGVICQIYPLKCQ